MSNWRGPKWRQRGQLQNARLQPQLMIIGCGMVFYVTAGFCVGFLLAWGLNLLASNSWKRAVGMHWTERARRLFPARVAAAINVWLVAANVAVGLQLLRGNATSAWLGPAAAAWLGAAISGFWMDRRIWPGLSFAMWFGQFVLYGMFWQVGLLLMVVGMITMPSHFGWQAWIIAAVLLASILSLVFGLTLAFLRGMRLVQPAPHRVHEIAQREAERAGARLNATWVNKGPAAHAFALLPMKDMLFSDSLLRLLSDAELASVCAHEAAHLTESKWVFTGRVLGTLKLYPLIFISPASHRFGLSGVLALAAVSFILLSFHRRVAGMMEKRADAAAVGQTTDPAIYAATLEKLYAINQMPAVMPKRNNLIHPNLYDRMLAAGVTPAYERPKPPRRMAWTPLCLYALLVLHFVIVISSKEANQRDVSLDEQITGGDERIHLNGER